MALNQLDQVYVKSISRLKKPVSHSDLSVLQNGFKVSRRLEGKTWKVLFHKAFFVRFGKITRSQNRKSN